MHGVLTPEQRSEIIIESDGSLNNVMLLTEERVKSVIYNDSLNLINPDAFTYEIMLVKEEGEIELLDLKVGNFSIKSKVSLIKYFKDNILKELSDKLKGDINIGNGIYVLIGTGVITQFDNIGTVFVKITPTQVLRIDSLTNLSYALQRNIVIATQTGLLRKYLNNVEPSKFKKQ